MESIFYVISLVCYIVVILVNMYAYKKSTKRLMDSHVKDLKIRYKEIDEVMINALKVTLDLCILREDYIQAARAKRLLDNYQSNNIHKDEPKA